MSDWDEDERLLEVWRHGESKAVRNAAGRELYQRHVEVVFRFLCNKVPSARLEEAIQETFATAFEAAKRGRIINERAFRSFLLGTALNVVRSGNRKYWREQSEFDAERHSTADVSPGPYTIVVRKEQERILLEGLRSVPFDDQVLLELSYFQGRDHKAIADIVGMDYAKVRRRLYTSRERLKREISKLEASEELLASTLSNLEGWAAGVREQFDDRTDGSAASASPDSDRTNPNG